MTKLIFFSDIDFDGSPKVRAKPCDPEVVSQYAQAYNDKKEMPPVDLFWDKDAKKMYLADGRHRCAAMIAIKRTAITATVWQGDYAACLTFALLANSHHGLQRSPADKRKCVESAIAHWPDAPYTQIAKLADVDDKTAKSVRLEMEAKKKIKPSATRTSVEGKVIPATISRQPRNSEAESDPPPKPPVMEDHMGFPIPKMVQQYWERIPEIDELLSGLKRVIGCIKQAQRDQDPMFGEVNCSGAIGDIERAYHNIGLAMPYAVCTSCQGHPETQKKGCRLCFGRGLISEFAWERIVPEEVKKIRTGK